MNLNLLTNINHSFFCNRNLRLVKRITDKNNRTVIEFRSPSSHSGIKVPYKAIVITPQVDIKNTDYIRWLVDNQDVKSMDDSDNIVDLLSKELAFAVNNPDYPYRIGVSNSLRSSFEPFGFSSSSESTKDTATIIPLGDINIEITPQIEDQELLDVIKEYTIPKDIRNSIRIPHSIRAPRFHIQTYYMMKR